MILDTFEKSGLYENLSERIGEAMKYIRQTNLGSLETGRHEIEGDNIFVVVQEYNTKPADQAKWEAHRRYIDIQCIVKGYERIGIGQLDKMKTTEEYSDEKDVLFAEGSGKYIDIAEGSFMLIYPHEAHKPGLTVREPTRVKKAVVKVRV